MEITKVHKYTAFFLLSLVLGVTLQYYQSKNNNSYLAQESFDKFTELNQKYSVKAITTVTGEDEGSQNSFASLLQASVLIDTTQQPTQVEIEQTTSKKLLFKLKDQEDTIDNIMAIYLPESASDLEQIAQEYQSKIDEIDFIEPDYEITINNQNADYEKELAKAVESNPNNFQTNKGASLVVAVIDTGADILHPVLREHRWTQENEVRNNNSDDDKNGFKDDKYGWDFVNNNERSYVDNGGHGTHVSGIIANSNFAVKIMPIKVIEEKKGNLSSVIRGIKYAADNNADIINFSIGTTENSKALKTATEYALKKGIIIVAAAGNAGDDTPYYPAAYDQVIAVGATNKEGERLSKSNYGTWVNIFAQGQNILSSAPGNEYEYKSGTSQAAAVVTAEIVKIKSQIPQITAKNLLTQVNLNL